MVSAQDGNPVDGKRGRFLVPGDMVAGRFRIERLWGQDIIGETYLATDTKGDKPVAIRVLPREAIPDGSTLERLKSDVRSASQLTHKNIVGTLGTGQLAGGEAYVVQEHVDGTRLSTVIQERLASGKRFGIVGAYNVVAHLCNALEFAHKTRVHGTLCPLTIVVSDTGRVKIADFPISRLCYMVPQWRKTVPAEARGFWAPEVEASASIITHRVDVWSLGLVMWQMLAGELPAPSAPGHRPALLSTVVKGLPEGLDEIITRCLESEPASRWKSVADLKAALADLVERRSAESLSAPSMEDPIQSPIEEGEDMGLDLEIDVERPLTIPPPPASAAAQPGARPMPPIPKPVPPQPPWSFQATPPGDPEAPAPIAGLPPLAGANTGKDGHRPSLGPIDLDSLMSSVQDRDAEKWMITKDKMDHGPFRTREVIQMIVRWEVDGSAFIQDIEKGIRKKLREHEEFKETVERARVAKIKHEEQLALEQSAKAEKRGGIAKTFVVLIVLGVIGLVVGSIFAGRAIYKSAVQDGQDIDELIASGKVKIDIGKGGIVDEKVAHKGKRRGGGGGGGGGGSAASYDDYMNQAVNLGDVDGDGGQTQLSQAQVNAVMSSQGSAVYPCIYSELKKDSSLKKVSLKFAIEGATGTVQGVTITSGGSSEFQSCVASKMKKIKFPKFSSPRMGATFFFTVG